MSEYYEDLMPFEVTEALPLPPERLLRPQEEVQIDTDNPLLDAAKMEQLCGIRGNLVADIIAGGKSFKLVDIRDVSPKKGFILMDDNYSILKDCGFKELNKGAHIKIGRNHHQDKFTYSDSVSRDHFELSYKRRGLFLKNLNPTNETVVTAILKTDKPAPHFRLPVDIVEDRTQMVVDRMLVHPNYGEKDETAPYGYYMNLPVIGRDSVSVNGGVYLGGSAREAILVDGKSTIIKHVYDEVESDLSKAFKDNETLLTHAILLKVMHKVQEVIPYDLSKTEYLSQEYIGDKLVGLSTFLKEKAGVCRHQGLLAAYLLERLIDDGYMDGTVGVERNTVTVLGGSHAWAVLKTRSHEPERLIVIDPAQSFIGTKEQAQHENRWEYRLSTDKYN